MKKASYKGIKVDLPDNVSISAFKDIVDQCGSDYSITVQGVVDLLSRKLYGKAQENEKLNKLIESLTPGGSEFVGEPEYCIKYVNEYQGSQQEFIKELILDKEKLVEQKKKLIKESYELLEALKELYDFNLNDIGYLDIALNHAESAIKKATE